MREVNAVANVAAQSDPTVAIPAAGALRAIGAKVTAPRVQVLRCLQAAPAPMTHRDVLEVLRERT